MVFIAYSDIETRNRKTVSKMISWLPKLLGSLLFRMVQRCVQALPSSLLRFRPFAVYEIRLGEICLGEPTQAASDQSGQVRWIASQDEARQLDNIATAKNIAAWNGTTRRAAVLWKKNRPVGVAWVAAQWFAEDELGLHYQLADDEVWLFASVVAPDFRRQGSYTQLLEFLKAELPRGGFTRILHGVSVGNTPSRKAHARQGARQLGTIFAAKSLGLAVCKVGGLVRRVSRRGWAWRRAVELVVDRT